MALQDCDLVQKKLVNILPGLNIKGTPKASGQRLVYFVDFTPTEEVDWSGWGICVLKIMLAPTAESISRFQREIRVLNELKSEFYPKHLYNNIFSEDPITGESIYPHWFITIEEKLTGSPLRTILSQPLGEKRVKEFGIRLIEALDLLWKGTKQYVHRDLSPENILIDGGTSIRIIDLGLVRETGELGYTNDLSEWGPCNPQYCSPEQSLNDKKNISYKSDLFIIGILFFEMLSGVHPFWETSIQTRDQMFRAIREKQHDDLVKKYNVSPMMKVIVDKLLCKKPFERYRRPEDLKSDLVSLET